MIGYGPSDALNHVEAMMVFTPHWRLVLGGFIGGIGGGGPEIWQNNINFDGALDGHEDAYLGAVNSHVGDWFSDSAQNMRSDATLEYLKFNKIGADGKYTDPTTTHVFDYSPQRAGAGSTTIPYILTCCISWTTARMRGLGSRGRIYPPFGIGVSPAGGMEISVAFQEAVLASGRELLDALKVFVLPGGYEPVIASNGAKGSSVPGPNVPITGVSVGSVIDVQRRRKDALRETYIHADWP